MGVEPLRIGRRVLVACYATHDGVAALHEALADALERIDRHVPGGALDELHAGLFARAVRGWRLGERATEAPFEYGSYGLVVERGAERFAIGAGHRPELVVIVVPDGASARRARQHAGVARRVASLATTDIHKVGRDTSLRAGSLVHVVAPWPDAPTLAAEWRVSDRAPSDFAGDEVRVLTPERGQIAHARLVLQLEQAVAGLRATARTRPTIEDDLLMAKLGPQRLEALDDLRETLEALGWTPAQSTLSADTVRFLEARAAHDWTTALDALKTLGWWDAA